MAVTRSVYHCTPPILGSMSLLISGNHGEKINVLHDLRSFMINNTIANEPSLLLCFPTLFDELRQPIEATIKYEIAKTIFTFTKQTGVYFDLSQLRYLERLADKEADEKVKQELENIIFWHENFMYCEIMGGGVKTYSGEMKHYFPNAPLAL
ncbi:hypothetical protein [Alteribacter aurantiacus]|uniref:hypothetical protein n=1 Tax=Alteribacter aurantiacus TaxID=254410 RepID=UPI00047DD4F3|nr:hypothetical protein [Alteribacter aurantiacus]